MSETNEFLKELGVKQDSEAFPVPEETPVEEVKAEEAEKPKEETDEDGFKAKNRRERRLLAENQRLREEAIAQAARLQGIAEAREVRNDEEADYLKKVERIYGTATPEAKEATELLKEALRGVHESARKEALEEAVAKVNEDRDSEASAVKAEEENLEEMMDRLEEDHGANFDDEATRQGFFTLLEKLSPKDKDGNIVEYADPETTWEVYKSRSTGDTSRAKDLASRSMAKGGSTGASTLKDDTLERTLRDLGIL